MRIIKINIDGHEFEFVCNSRNTRTGFAHDCTLFINGIEQPLATCYYLNRTWERYPFQTVCTTALNKAIDTWLEYMRREFMNAHNYERMSTKRRIAFENSVKNESFMVITSKCLHDLEYGTH